jgi:hypothetical protein
MKTKIAILAALLITAVNTQALQYQIGNNSSVVATTEDPGLVIGTSLSSTLAGTAFNLNDGGSTTFNFFQIWATESAVNPVDDLDPKPITATLDFVTPNIDAVIQGVTFGATINLLYDKAVLTWDAPALISVSDRQFSVALSNVEFSKGSFLDFDLGKSKSWVKATVTQISSGVTASSVPDGGSTAMLLGATLFALGFVRRKS